MGRSLPVSSSPGACQWHSPKCSRLFSSEKRWQCELPPVLPVTPRSTYPGDIRFGVGVEVTRPDVHYRRKAEGA